MSSNRFVNETGFSVSLGPVTRTVGELEKLPVNKRLYSLNGEIGVPSRTLLKVLESIEHIHSFDLPYLLSLLVQNRLTGYLILIDLENRISGVTLIKGCISQVDISDQQSFIGQILLNLGFVDPEDLSEILKMPSDGKKIAQRLIDANLISPHSLDEAMKEQMNIRLSKLIMNTELRMSFSTEDLNESHGAMISPSNYDHYLCLWVTTKLSQEWLRNHYFEDSDFPLAKTSQFQDSDFIFNEPLLKENKGELLEALAKGRSISQLCSNSNLGEDQALKIIHILYCKNFILFDRSRIVESFDEQLKRVTKWLIRFQESSNPLDLMIELGGSKTFSQNEIDQFFANVLVMIGPEPSRGDPELLINQYSKLKEAILYFQNQVDSPHKIKDLEKRYEEDRLKRVKEKDKKVESFIQSIQSEKWSLALETLTEVEGLTDEYPLLALNIALMYTQLLDGASQKEIQIKNIESFLRLVPAESKSGDKYHYILGKVSLGKGDLITAKLSFERALLLNSKNMNAKKELLILSSSVKR